MRQIEIVSKFIKNFVWSMVLEGILIIVTAVLILVYPQFLNILVACILIISGIICFVVAARAHKYSKIEIEL
ncbi:MAG TPA: hypothetical protein PLB74_01050 [Candidatus Paceibacterota bacterium]|nr:hypothetical protein [Candidatus Paceibacterota bacterium]HOL54127.1 hypothetical protein [Candidatus Paceibacterota bacterium]HON21930.1 hypothetical protein [Candidatus Paceibacterota bacterium]HOV88637.1 hypothetical protein [Candidatus Paceibacterota bacterium]HPP17207.1 hypothetical protein [Candidatus Paceibacterota bacterium]